MRAHRVSTFSALVAVCLAVVTASAQERVIPHAQDKPPGPALSPAEAIQKMTVPKGFTVEAVAHEPDIVNPVAMTIDERGRFWITESLEYPRKAPGPGRDRVKILEDTDADGKADKFTVFAEGLNIPSGIAVGHGGVWVANAPDILFMQDTDGDGKADKQQVVVTGFGRNDTHELPNSLTWGPDGWLYGLNGVFNHSHVKYPESSPHYQKDHPGWPITCAMFRIHPRTREFQVFCEGTSNPWGIAFNDEGEAFISACVIDHLWHLVETGYYHRQGGPYPPFTWKIDSIVKHKHQKAAYCGIHYFDSDAYPDQYRGKLYMGNIHGGCINVDRIERDGSTYKGFGEPDFLTANDAWFMPVVQKTGPDGSLYILDWYDRYHCYQDANRDPNGIDRLKGRLYRVRYQETPRAPKDLNLASESDVQLVARLNARNDWTRSTARRILQERSGTSFEKVTPAGQSLLKLAQDEAAPTAQRLQAFWSLSLAPLGGNEIEKLMGSKNELIRAAAVRFTTNVFVPQCVRGDEGIQQMVGGISINGLEDESPLVRRQGLILLTRLSSLMRTYVVYDDVLIQSIGQTGTDPVLQRLAWQTVKAYAPRANGFLAKLLQSESVRKAPIANELVTRGVEWMLGQPNLDSRELANLFQSLASANPGAARDVLAALATKIQSGELKGDRLAAVKQELSPRLKSIFEGPTNAPLYLNAAFLATALGDSAGYVAARKAVETASLTDDQRLAAVGALVAAGQDEVLGSIAKIFEQTPPASSDFKGKLLAALARLDDPEVGKLALHFYAKMEPDLQPKAIELLTQRVIWSKALLAAVEKKAIPVNALNLNQVRKLLASKDADLIKQVTATWGTVRDQRNPQREQVIADMRRFLRANAGNAIEGQKVYMKVCGQCHKLFGEGAEVGPDITLNGRSSFEQLLSNVFDPSLVIGASYQARIVVTTEGRVLTGLVTEDNAQRIILKVQGGKFETISRDQIEETKLLELSMMPEDLEKQLKPNELADLFAYITLDKPPTDPKARRLPGSTGVTPRQASDASQFSELVNEVAPGFALTESGEGGVSILEDHFGRPGVLRTHPVSRDKATVMTRIVTLPAGKKSRLIVDVSHDPMGDWRLLVVGNGERLVDEMISSKTAKDGWATFNADLSKFAGKEVRLQLINQANDWSYEFGYWGRVELITEE